MTLKSILFMILTIGSSCAFGAVTIFNVEASTVSGTADTGTTEAPIKTVFGGYAGPNGGCASPVANSTCNSCAAPELANRCSPTLAACAERSIHPDLLLTVTMAVDTVPANAVLLAQWAAGTTVNITPETTTTAPTQNGQTFQIQVKWSAICNAAFNDATCKGAGTGDLYVGLADPASTNTFANGASAKMTVRIRYQDPATSTLVTPNHSNSIPASVPFSDFQVFPGDEKVYIKDIWRGNTGPGDASGIKWSALRIFYAPDDGSHGFCSIPLNGANYSDLEINDKTSVQTSLKENSDRVTGLQNEVDYMFTAASVDESSIVTGFFDPTAMATTPERYIAKPGEVVGLLDGQQCFIATAAFGSSMEPQVELLRQFRNQFLNTNHLGRSFVRYYYKYSPPIADFIAQHETLRTLIRGMLWPFILMAEMALQWGFLPMTGAILLIALSAFVLARKVRGPRET